MEEIINDLTGYIAITATVAIFYVIIYLSIVPQINSKVPTTQKLRLRYVNIPFNNKSSLKGFKNNHQRSKDENNNTKH